MRLCATHLLLVLVSLACCPCAEAQESLTDRLAMHITGDRLTLGLSEKEVLAMCDKGCPTGILLVCKEMRLLATEGGKPQIECSDVAFCAASKVEGRAAHLRFDCEAQTVCLAGTDREPVTLQVSQDGDDSQDVKLTADEVQLDLKTLAVALRSAKASIKFPNTARPAPSDDADPPSDPPHLQR